MKLFTIGVKSIIIMNLYLTTAIYSFIFLYRFLNTYSKEVLPVNKFVKKLINV
jgi:hypothetical protein